MANYERIMRLRPEVRQFLRSRRWVHRGDVIAYGPNIRCDAFSTDEQGFRHSTFGGATLSAREAIAHERYGLVLGPSNVYGFGLAGNENTIPSLLAERLGFPFANISLPEGTSRNLYGLLAAIVDEARNPPTAVVHISGGDFTAVCYTAIADPVFGPPNLKQMDMALRERGGFPAEPQIEPLLAFTRLWTRAIGQLCEGCGARLVFGNDTTFFEKRNPSEFELQCELGKSVAPAQELRFATHKRYVRDFAANRDAMAKSLGVPIAGPGLANDLGFIDEYHYDAAGTQALAQDFGDALEALLAR
ncbi:MAG TPA: hypothetical protein VM308_07165 [Sphingomicrobium sp.]|nr:hypothetical protein [Sphingomicrobium sp.]